MIDNTSMNNKERGGRFTSSMVFNLVQYGSIKMNETQLAAWKEKNPKSKAKNMAGGFDAKGKGYIQEKIYERRMKSTLDSDAYSQPMAWGNIMEMYLYSILGTEYEMTSKATKLHPLYGKFWSGSADMLVKEFSLVKVISEIKCYGKKGFAAYVDKMQEAKKAKDVSIFKDAYPKEYWQIVSNACIHDAPEGEVMAFMPYKSQFPEIKEIVEGLEDADIWKYRFIVEKPINSLPFLPDDGYYDNINTYRFTIPEADKVLLTKRIVEANKILKVASV